MNLPKTAFQFILHFARQQRAKFSILILMSCIWGTNDAFFPYFLKRIVNTLENYKGDPHQIYYALSGTLILLVLFWSINEIAARIQGIVSIYAFPKFRAEIRKSVFDYVKQHSHEYFSNHFAGNIAKKIAALPSSAQVIMEIICFQFVVVTLGAVIVLVMMWLTKPFFAAILLIWLILHLGLTGLFMSYGNKLWEIHSDSVSELSGKIVDTFTNILNVRLFSRGKYETQYLEPFQNDEIKKSEKAMWLIETMRFGLGFSGLFLVFGMVFGLLKGWSDGWVTLGDFTQVGMQSFWILGWIWHTSYQISVYVRELGTVNEALTLIQKGHDLVDISNAQSITVRHGEIRFENVSFSYGKKRAVFENLNVVIHPGEKIGLVGFSGSGKSTFVNLILRFYDLQSGKILIDGQNIAKVTQDSLREQIAMIPQDPSLFHRTLMENIQYGRLDATSDEVIHASKLAHCHEFIEKLEDGYNALVGERGIKLSGGQRQRIAIARAILKNAPILILDEATSSLDSVTEKLIQDSLHTLMENRTTIVVAHRLSTLSNMDRIIVFHKGQVIEDGSQEALLKANGHFATLWNMQADGFLPDESA
ncbi:MAG: ABC transporter ATP-binding protein [Proteobacteria bacterium]|nr:ABC transporter ATP-binding protein [Pseudomonadota bacterium]